MESNNSYTSWADQWDYSNPDPVPHTKNSSHGGGTKGKYSRKVEDGFGKTKAATSTGVKKVKEGASMGFHWIKNKYQKTTQKR